MGWGDDIKYRPPSSDEESATPSHVKSRRLGTHSEFVGLWNEVRAAFALWAALVVVNGAFAIIFIFSQSSSPALEVCATVGMTAVIVAFVLSERRSLATLYRTSGFTRTTFFFPGVALAATWLFMTGYFWALHQLGARDVHVLSNFRECGWPLWSAFVLTAVIPPLIEESAFRGFIFGRLMRVMNPRDAMIVQAMMFSVLHFAPLIFVSHFVMGIIFGLLRMKTRSLWPSILVHALWNAFVVAREMNA